MNTFFLVWWGFMLGVMTGSYFRVKILNKKKVKPLEKRLENAKVYTQEYFKLINKLEPIEEYLQKEYGLTFTKIEKLILEKNYKENNIIDINNFRKFK